MSKRKERIEDLAKRSRFRIADIQVQPDCMQIVRDQETISLEPRMMEVLVVLAMHVGETVSKERLLVDVWGSKVYGDSPVSKTVSNLRKLLGDDARNPRYIETISKIGFKLIASVDLPEDYRRLPSERWTEESPYVGLSAFDAKHASVFCGRSRITADLLRAMRSQIESQRRFVLIVGASGCGKTSLLHAGAIPLLSKRDGFDGLRSLSVASCDLASVPAEDPLTPLIAGLANWKIGDREVFPPQTTEQLKSLLTETPNSIRSFIAEAFAPNHTHGLDLQPHTHLLLTIDHAEALVTAADINAAAVVGFERILQALCACPNVLVTMIARGDFYLKLIEALPTLAEHKSGDGHLDVTAPREGEIAEIIRTPAWKADLSFETHSKNRNRLDDVLRDAAITQPDVLPLLQHTLLQLYENCDKRERLLTFASYNEIGGLEGAIAHRAEQVFAELPSEAQASLNSVLAQLIVPDSETIRARKAYKDELSPDASLLVDAFITGRLFVGDYSEGRPIFGVAHEALLRRWPRAVDWMQDNQRLLLAKTRLQRAAERWDKEGRKSDHLLNPGLPLAEAIDTANSPALNIDRIEREFIFQSKKNKVRALRIRKIAMATLVGLTIASTALAIVSIRSLRLAQSQKAKSADLASYLVGEVADNVDSTGNLALIEDMGEKILSYCKDMDASQMGALDMTSCSKAWRKVGEVRMEKSEYEKAEAHFARAIALSASAKMIRGTDPKIITEFGRAHSSMGKLKAYQSDIGEALNEWEKYLSETESLMAIDGKNPDYIIEKSYALTNVGYSHRQIGDNNKALLYFRKSVQLKNKARKIKDTSDWHFDTIVTESFIADIEASNGQLSTSYISYARLIKDLEKLLEGERYALEWERQLTSLLHFRTLLAIDVGDMQTAMSLNSEASSRLLSLASAEKSNKYWHSLYANALYDSAEIARHTHDRAETIKKLDMAYGILLRNNGRTSNLETQKAITAFRLGIAHDNAFGDQTAESALRKLKRLSDEGNAYSTLFAADALLLRSVVEKQRGHLNESNADAREAHAYFHAIGSRHGKVALTSLRVRSALLDDAATVSEDDLSFLLSSGYRHPDFIAALSIFCESPRARSDQIRSACSAPRTQFPPADSMQQ